MSKSGFTLVELSIVLLIIGLLVGGILVGQSLIESAKMQSFVRQIQQMDIANANFKGKYKGLPGDSKVFSAIGNGDGVIADADGSIITFNGEMAAYWPQLQQSGFDPSGDKFSSTVTGTIRDEGVNRNIPATSISNCGIIVATMDFTPANNYYYVSNYDNSTVLDSNVSDCLLPTDALAYDSKVDDGLPGSGFVTSYDYTAQCTSASKYDITRKTQTCSIAIKLMNQTGQ